MKLRDELRSAHLEMGNTGAAYNPYENCGFESDLQHLDEIISVMDIDTADDSFAALELGAIITANQTESGKFESEMVFGMEAVMESIKRTGYKAKAMIKKLAGVVVAFCKRMVNVLVNKNLMIKKYGTLIEKLTDKLAVKTFEKADKKVSVRNFSTLPDLVKAATSIDDDLIESYIDDVEKTTSGDNNWKRFFDAACDGVLALVLLDNKTILAKPTAANMEKIIKDKKVIKLYDDLIKEHKFDKARDTALGEAKSALLTAARGIKAFTEDDVKVQAGLRKFVKVVEDTRDELIGDEKITEPNNLDEINGAVNKLGPLVAHGQAGITKLFKHTTSALAALATDMQKVLAA